MSRYDGVTLERVVKQARTVAVVGASDNPQRPSNEVARYLHAQGLRIFPVNPKLESLFGLPAFGSLAEIGEPVDIVDVFRRPSATPEVAEQAVAAGAGTLWLQLGVINDEAARIAERGGLTVIMDRCLAVEHRRLLRTSSGPHG
ncbi:MAG: CoA-binding protein [Pseudonocardiaceae bacterium]|nr:CoA-binding protein [Pseudonocardiaceae bacterium]